MAGRVNYYFRQKVTEAELDLGFTLLETAERNAMLDMGQVGILAGGVVSEKSGGANLSVDITAAVGRDKLGQRVAFVSTQNLSMEKDENLAVTAVAGVGNSKVISVFLKFKRTLTDARTDGNSQTVYFREDEDFELVIRQGSEAPAPAAPPLDSTMLLLCDITRTYGGTTITAGMISTARREDAIVVAGSPHPLRRGRAKDALADLLGWFNAHVNGTQDKHPATAVTYGGSPNWPDGTAVTSNNVEAALDEVVSDLGDSSGSAKVGAAAYAPANGIFALAAGTVQSQLRALADRNDRPDVLPVGSLITFNTAIAANDGKAQLRVSTAGNPVTITLPPPASSVGRRIYVSDVAGTFGTNPCTVARNAAESIQGLAANRVLNAPWGSYCFWCDGTNWFMS